tara:strand:- start:26 stop:712 length:687 start_codon:yes stop_codon:yes gene_type:complete
MTTLISLSDRPALTDITWPVLREYGNRHGYKVKLLEETLLPDRHIAWSKIVALLNTFKEGVDKIFWVDDDCLITDTTKSLEDIENEDPFDHILLAKDFQFINAEQLSTINTGVMLCKNTKNTKDYFEATLDVNDSCPSCNFNPRWQHPWEQYALDRVHLELGEDSPVKVLPPPKLQTLLCFATGQNYRFLKPECLWYPGGFIAHSAGVKPFEARLSLLRHAAENHVKR